MPDEVLQKPLHSKKCTAWCEISYRGIIGPFWFEDNNENVVTINKERYVEVLDKFWDALSAVSKKTDWFQQDGATPHTAKISMKWLKDHFHSRVISRGLAFFWSPHSPDLSHPDFFLWGYLKDRVYKTKPQTIPELKRIIEQTVREIPVQVCRDVMTNFCKRINQCIARKGKHLEHVH